MTKNVSVDGSKITNWETFHNLFEELLGFPGFYGRNMDAWIDCMTSIDVLEGGLTKLHVRTGEVMVLCISGVSELKKRCPDIYDNLIESSAFVNWRRIERNVPAVLALSFYM